MSIDLFKKVALTAIVVGVVFLFILIAPFLIAGLLLLVWGLIALVVFSFIIYAIMEWLRER